MVLERQGDGYVVEIARAMARSSAGEPRAKPEEIQQAQSQTSEKELFGNNSDSSDLEDGLIAESAGEISDSGSRNGASAQRTPVKAPVPKRARPTEPEPSSASSPKILKRDSVTCAVSANSRPQQPVSSVAGKTVAAATTTTTTTATATRANKSNSSSSGSSSSSDSDGSEEEDKKPQQPVSRPMGLKALKKPQPEESSD